MAKREKILITGGTGLVGTNLFKRLRQEDNEVIAVGSQYDLRDPKVTDELFKKTKPDVVFHLAAKVGGIFANTTYKAAFYSDNVLINTNLINACIIHKIQYVFAMGTGCAYPKRLEGDILKEETFLDGIPETTNDAYAYAKRGMLVHLKALAEQNLIRYCYCIPANIYGPHDNFHPKNSHVVPGLIRRFCEAKEKRSNCVTMWGSGKAKRDFLFIEDCVEAMITLLNCRFEGAVNVATGESTTINELVHEIKTASGFSGSVENDMSFPEGQTERIFHIEKIKSIGWIPRYSLKKGIEATVEWFFANKERISER